ncbi:MAG: hypothetical protein HJJLKODD_02183 [Phycisphaerae bacterium]|nr:hypothetical protein [Phycisphaerae bacterium]
MITADLEVFSQLARIYLYTYNEAGFINYLKHQWTTDELVQLLESDDHDLIKLAALALGLVGKIEHSAQLVKALQSDDSTICAVAEFSLWSIWYRAAGTDAELQLRSVHHQTYETGRALVEQLQVAYPDWSEVYHQSGILHFKAHQFVSALDDFRTALLLNEYHFGVLAAIGHVHTQLGMYSQAEDYYRQALQIHPRMSGVRQTLQAVRSLQDSSSSLPIE